MRDTQKLKVRVSILLIVSITLTLILVSKALSIRDNHFYPSNFCISDLVLSNTPKAETEKVLNEYFMKQKLQLHISKNMVSLELEASGIKVNMTETLRIIEDSSLSAVSNLTERITAKAISPVFDIDEVLLTNALNKVVSDNSFPAVNAQAFYQANEGLRYVTHKNGYLINPELAREKVQAALVKGQLSVQLEGQEIEPTITLTQLNTVQDVLGVATKPNLILNNWERLLIAELDDTIILPGELFRLEETWQESNIDMNKTSNLRTNLHNMLKKIDYPNYFTYDEAQFALQNHLPNPILINLEQMDEVLWLSIIGNQKDIPRQTTIVEEEHIISPAVVKKTDKNLVAGEQKVVPGQDTITKKKYQLVKQNGNIIEKVLLEEKRLLGSDTIIYLGYGTVNK